MKLLMALVTMSVSLSRASDEKVAVTDLFYAPTSGRFVVIESADPGWKVKYEKQNGLPPISVFIGPPDRLAPQELGYVQHDVKFRVLSLTFRSGLNLDFKYDGNRLTDLFAVPAHMRSVPHDKLVHFESLIPLIPNANLMADKLRIVRPADLYAQLRAEPELPTLAQALDCERGLSAEALSKRQAPR